MSVITIQGFLTNIDKYNTAKIVFLDDYNKDEMNKLSFTKTYINQKCRKDGRGCNYSPMIDNTTFKVKCGKIHIGYIVSDNTIKIVNIRELIQHQVECVVLSKNYNFQKNGVHYKGWSLILQEMRLLEL